MSVHADEARAYSDEIDLLAYLRVIWRRRSIVLGVTVAAMVVVLAASLLSPRQWQANALVMVPQPPQVEQAQVVGGIQGSSPLVVFTQETYARLLKSVVLLEKVIERLGLKLTPEELARMVTAKSIRDTRFVEVTVRGAGAQEVEAIANALAEALVEYDRQVINAELTQSLKFVETQLARVKEDLQAREETLKEFNLRENIALLDAAVGRRLSQSTSLRWAYDQNRIELGVATRRLARLKEELALTSPMRAGLSSVESHSFRTSVAARLRTQLASLEADRAALLERFTPSHPAVAAIDAQIRRTREDLVGAESREPRTEEQRANVVREQLESQKASLEVEVAGLQAGDQLLGGAITHVESEYKMLSARLAEKRAELNRLTREAEAAKNAFSTISARATESVMAEGMKGGFVRVVDRAVARPVARGTVTKTGIATVLGLAAGVLAAFVMEYLKIPPALPAASAPPSVDPAPARRKEAEA